MDKIKDIADRQSGYFTPKQAIAAGYPDPNHGYYVQHGHWLKICRGIYRLPGYPDSPAAAFTRWSFWSRNRHEQPQAVISHESALVVHGLAEWNGEVHLSVPPAFRKLSAPGCIIHKQALRLSELESRPGFLVTSLERTLADLRESLIRQGRWSELVKQVEKSSTPVSRPEPIESGALRAEPLAGSLSAWGGAPAPQDAPGAEELAVGAERLPMHERIFQMICNRTTRPRERRRAEAGFTLVELLVVMAIISILAGMLLPALEKALASARAVQCANNLKQQGTAIVLYADQFADALVPARINYAGGWWMHYLYYARLFDTKVTSGYYPDIMHCPSMDLAVNNGAFFAGRFHYGTNLYLNPTLMNVGDQPKKLAAIDHPAERFSVTDINNTSGAGGTNKWPVGWQHEDYRHSGTLRMLFIDTHVATYSNQLPISASAVYPW